MSSIGIEEIHYPTIYRKALAASKEREARFWGLLGTNVSLMAIPPIIDAVAGEGPKPLIFYPCIFLAVVTTVMFMNQSPKEYLDCLRLAERAKSLSWLYMMKVRPFAGATTDATEQFLESIEKLISQHKSIAGLLASIKIEATDIAKLGAAREMPLEARVQLYGERRIKDQIDEFSTKAAVSLTQFRLLSYFIILMQVATLWFCYGNKAELNKEALACIAVTIGVLSWRDSRKLKERNNTLGKAAQLLDPLYARCKLASNETEFARLVQRTESVLANEHRLWLIASGDEGDEEQAILAPSVVRRCVQKPIEISATSAVGHGEIETMEGLEKYSPGDWIITGLKGEKWPVSPETFAKKYRAVPNKDGIFCKKPVEIEAVQMHCIFTVNARWGLLQGKPRDWLLFSDSTDAYICAADVFERSYEFVD